MSGAPAAGQHWQAGDYARHAGFVPALGADVLALLAPQAGERILDLGCGDGVLTLRLVQAGAKVTALDADPSMLAAARDKGLDTVLGDAHDPLPGGPYDAVFSNAVLHWMRDPPRVIARVFDALRPGGRFVAEQGGFGNIAAIVTALNAVRRERGLAPLSPWDYPSPATQTRRLEAAGFRVTAMQLIPRPTPLPTGMAGWLETFAGPAMADIAPAGRAGFLDRVVALLPALHDPAEGWSADYVRLRFAAIRP